MSLLLLLRPQRALVVKGAARLQGLDFNGVRVEHTSARPIESIAQRSSPVSVGRTGNYQTSRRT